MQSSELTNFYSLRADANALGGYLEEPFRTTIAPLAPVSLPPVGGFATGRSEAFALEHIVRCSAAYTRVSGEEYKGGTVSILIKSVVEDLNILDVVTAARIVAQLSIVVPPDRKELQVSTAGSTFVDLCVKVDPKTQLKDPVWNERLQRHEHDAAGRPLGFTLADAEKEGRQQADRVINSFKDSTEHGPWARRRFEWMSAAQGRTGRLCSLIDGFRTGPCEGHVVTIPNVGRFIFGELLISRDSAELVSIRAELGCPVKGKISISTGGGGGLGNF